MEIPDFSKEQTIRLLFDFMHRSAFHHAMWFHEVAEKLGSGKAYEILGQVYRSGYDIQMKRLAKTLGFEMKEEVPSFLLDFPKEKLNELRESIAINWLANDGIWFQAVEGSNGMAAAKQCNDASWAHFSPFEAWSIKRLLGLPANPGLDGLKEALKLRLYAFINEQSITDEKSESFVFRMNNCRVQAARKRKGLADYPCKSAGLIEYPEFAKAIDARIKTECICCPPDAHPEEYFCAWKFYLAY